MLWCVAASGRGGGGGGGVRQQARAARAARGVQRPGDALPQTLAAQCAALRTQNASETTQKWRRCVAARASCMRAGRSGRSSARRASAAVAAAAPSRPVSQQRREHALTTAHEASTLAPKEGRACEVGFVEQQQEGRALQLARAQRLGAQRSAKMSANQTQMTANAQRKTQTHSLQRRAALLQPRPRRRVHHVPSAARAAARASARKRSDKEKQKRQTHTRTCASAKYLSQMDRSAAAPPRSHSTTLAPPTSRRPMFNPARVRKNGCVSAAAQERCRWRAARAHGAVCCRAPRGGGVSAARCAHRRWAGRARARAAGRRAARAAP